MVTIKIKMKEEEGGGRTEKEKGGGRNKIGEGGGGP